MEYHFQIHKEKKGYWAECVELEGCSTQAETKEDLLKQMEESLNLYLSEPESSKLIFPMPKRKETGKNVIKVAVEPKVAFATLLRLCRLKEGLTQSEAAKKMNLGGLYSYQKLESPKKTNPRLETLKLVKKLFPRFPIHAVFS